VGYERAVDTRTRASLAAKAATTQLKTIDVRLQHTEQTQERMAQMLEDNRICRRSSRPVRSQGKC
jgi:hypothetical protein